MFAERFILTLKNMMWKHFTAVGNQQWDNNLLQAIITKYNNKIHCSINTTPQKESTGDTSTVVDTSSDTPQKIRAKFRVGDRVRVFKYKTMFDKGYVAKWTNEIFLIKHVPVPISGSGTFSPEIPDHSLCIDLIILIHFLCCLGDLWHE